MRESLKRCNTSSISSESCRGHGI